MKVKGYAVVEKTKHGSIEITVFSDPIKAKDYYNLVDNARGCHCKSKKECDSNLICSLFELIELKGNTKKKRFMK